jgi:hypothetical protein
VWPTVERASPWNFRESVLPEFTHATGQLLPHLRCPAIRRAPPSDHGRVIVTGLLPARLPVVSARMRRVAQTTRCELSEWPCHKRQTVRTSVTMTTGPLVLTHPDNRSGLSGPTCDPKTTPGHPKSSGGDPKSTGGGPKTAPAHPAQRTSPNTKPGLLEQKIRTRLREFLIHWCYASAVMFRNEPSIPL